jgi:hypothetical protein
MTAYRMFSDDALAKFRVFLKAANLPKHPMPEGAFDVAPPRRARDEGLDGDRKAALLNFLRGKLDAADFERVRRSLLADAPDAPAEDVDPYPDRDEDDLLDEFAGDPDELAGDEPAPFRGRPRVGGGQDPLRADKLRPAMDGAVQRARVSRSYAAMFPGALRLGVIPGQGPDRRARLAMDGATDFGSASASYRALFPEASHIKVIP